MRLWGISTTSKSLTANHEIQPHVALQSFQLRMISSAPRWKNRTQVDHALSRKDSFNIGSAGNRQLTPKIKYHRFAFLYYGCRTRVCFFHSWEDCNTFLLWSPGLFPLFVYFYLNFFQRRRAKKEIQSLINGVHLTRQNLTPVASLFFEVDKTKEISKQRKFPLLGT